MQANGRYRCEAAAQRTGFNFRLVGCRSSDPALGRLFSSIKPTATAKACRSGPAPVRWHIHQPRSLAMSPRSPNRTTIAASDALT